MVYNNFCAGVSGDIKTISKSKNVQKHGSAPINKLLRSVNQVANTLLFCFT